MPAPYSFRVRVDRGPHDSIDCTDRQIVLYESTTGPIVLRNKKDDGALKDAAHFELIGRGYATEREADAAGLQYQSALIIALARVRVGVDLGFRSPTAMATPEGLEWLRQQLGVARLLNDVHGVMVYEPEPEPKFARQQFALQRSAQVVGVCQAFGEALSAHHSLTERERLSFILFNASFFQTTADTRFLLLVMAVEALIELQPKSDASRAHVDQLIALTHAADIEPSERDSMLGALRWLSDESISQAGRRLVASRLGQREYDGRRAPTFFNRAYQMRSNLVHGNMSYPSFDQVNAISGPLEEFVADLLTVPIIGDRTQT